MALPTGPSGSVGRLAAFHTVSALTVPSLVGLFALYLLCACHDDGDEAEDATVDTVGPDDSGNPDQGADVPPDGGDDAVDVSATDGGTDQDGDDCPVDGLAWGRGGEFMLPGTDCQSCHTEGGSAVSVFTISGTVFVGPDCPQPVAGASVDLVDSEGTEATLLSNEEGNFFTSDPLVPPYHVSVTSGGASSEMITGFNNGSCNSCHAEDSSLGFVSVAEP